MSDSTSQVVLQELAEVTARRDRDLAELEAARRIIEEKTATVHDAEVEIALLRRLHERASAGMSGAAAGVTVNGAGDAQAQVRERGARAGTLTRFGRPVSAGTTMRERIRDFITHHPTFTTQAVLTYLHAQDPNVPANSIRSEVAFQCRKGWAERIGNGLYRSLLCGADEDGQGSRARDLQQYMDTELQESALGKHCYDEQPLPLTHESKPVGV